MGFTFGMIVIILLLFKANMIYASVNARRAQVKFYIARKSLKRLPPIIFIPGILGVKLRDQERSKDIWGDSREIFFHKPDGLSYQLHTDNRIIASESLHRFNIVPGLLDSLVTWELRSTLEKSLGYKEHRDLFFLAYDWRKSYRELGDELRRTIDMLAHRFGDNQKVIIISQSMASLGVRSMLSQGGTDYSQRILKWYAYGPPWKGTYNSIKLLEHGYYPGTRYFHGFNFNDVATYPSAFQLLRQNASAIDVDGNLISDFDLYNHECWKKYNIANVLHQSLADNFWSELQNNLQDAKLFAEEVRQPSDQERQVPQVWFAGCKNLATVNAVWDGTRMETDPDKIEQRFPHLVQQALARGDEHIALSDYQSNACGPFVSDFKLAPVGESYIYMGRPGNHRNLLNYRQNTDLLLRDIIAESAKQ